MARQWIQFIVGFWIVISPWLFGFSAITFAKWSNVLVGLVLIVLNAWLIFARSKDEIVL